MSIGDVRLMDLSTIVGLANKEATQILDSKDDAGEMSPFQRRMQERTRGLQASLANETNIVLRLGSDGSFRELKKAPKAPVFLPADPNKAQCYWSPLEGRYVPMSDAEKAAALAAGASLGKSVLHEESDEVLKKINIYSPK